MTVLTPGLFQLGLEFFARSGIRPGSCLPPGSFGGEAFSPGVEPTGGKAKLLADDLCGFTARQPIGWVRFARSDTTFTNIFDLVAHDWHPIPDTAIRAGQPPEIPVATEVVDDGAGGSLLRVGWHPAVATWSFETTDSLIPPVTWTEYPAGGTSAEIPLNGAESQRYFRLRRP